MNLIGARETVETDAQPRQRDPEKAGNKKEKTAVSHASFAFFGTAGVAQRWFQTFPIGSLRVQVQSHGIFPLNFQQRNRDDPSRRFRRFLRLTLRRTYA
jgi:hypothetical protein